MQSLPDQIAHAHDLFVRSFLSDLEVAREFFTLYLPKDILHCIDLKSIELQPTSHITEFQKEFITDLLFKVFQTDNAGVMYLIVEHQSRNDKHMALRISEYTNMIARYHMQNSKDGLLPMVFTLVIYHGNRKYRAERGVYQIVNATEKLSKYYGKYEVIDFTKVDDNACSQSLSVGIMGFVLKHIYDNDLLPQLLKIMDNLELLNHSGRRHLVKIVLRYITVKGEFKDRNAFNRFVKSVISKKIGGSIMGLGEQLWHEGLQKGMQQGVLQGRQEGWQDCSRKVAQTLLMEGFEPDYVSLLTGLTVDSVQDLHKAVASREDCLCNSQVK
jgi:predicted transposase/invertase (TIGR01784 family)